LQQEIERSLFLSLVPGTVLAGDPARLESPRGALTFGALRPGLRLAIEILAESGASERELAERVVQLDGLTSLPHFFYCLERLRELGLLHYSVVTPAGPLITLAPIATGFRLDLRAVAPEQRFILSRFAYSRRCDGHLVLESPLARARVIPCCSAGGALVAELAAARSSPELASAVRGLDEQAAGQALALLAGAALVREVREDGSISEDDDEVMAQWEFHDLLFHARSRPGRHESPASATSRFLGRIAPPPAVTLPRLGDTVPLFRPDLDRLMTDGLPFTRVLEERVSIREHGQRPINHRQVGEFLYRTARVRWIAEPDPAGGRPYAISSRPYPGGGAAYELEVYLTVSLCSGIPPGFYHYEPVEHQLTAISGPTAYTEALLRSAAGASGMDRGPQILISLAARFQRLSWKYETIAYAAVLKDVGVLYQTMYLVATDMGLAPCALGSGDGVTLAEAAGLNYLEQSGVGEFMLGSVP
jgi:SagB-type dehydrogenase family enzyme